MSHSTKKNRAWWPERVGSTGRISDWQPFHLGGLEPGAGGDAGGGAGGAPADGLWFDPEAEQLPRGARVSGEPVLSFQGAGVLVKVVGAEASAAQALAWLQADPLFDGVLSLDLEWYAMHMTGGGSGGGGGRGGGGEKARGARGRGGRAVPEVKRRTGRVALMQLASPSRCVLFHISQMGYELPSALRDFLIDPRWLILVQDWGGSDEKRFVRSFGFSGKTSIPNLVDAQDVARGMGYLRVGVRAMTHSWLDPSYTKSRNVSRSDWEVESLTQRQVRYAALDALNIGWIYRALYRAHLAALASPQDAAPPPATAGTSPAAACCAACGQPFGAGKRAGGLLYACEEPGCKEAGVSMGGRAYMQHCASTGHPCTACEEECEACGRMMMLRGAEAARRYAAFLRSWIRRQEELLAAAGGGGGSRAGASGESASGESTAGASIDQEQ
ncbi:hypothetical protein MNEG_3818 [Monoraphidium neglectum]|uniref:3'-5' exonuclease domain-containing protein n=1 Tax=Monoraphidium neglectum TaxID=145388 RepID=A0A0D2LBQ0_9CHLO|nr:hypothetical protein MNEG_3818 [Monoraphidium neglectum]KIZ04139.1 hypothetical protein MNEG_3818 [Monoraphidium neglectum]|eukprot:XP_013903158.1 hypothetical protein MNEG_3818 [Monoraphidium neglectum]